MVVTLEIGYNFAVNAKEGNSEGQDFWFICYTKSLHTIKKTFKCRWDIEFDERDDMVVGKYYQKWGDSNLSYVLLTDSHVAYMYAHLVKVIKFLMPPKSHWVFGMMRCLNCHQKRLLLVGIRSTIALPNDNE